MFAVIDLIFLLHLASTSQDNILIQVDDKLNETLEELI